MLDRLFVFFPSREMLGDPGDLGLEFEDIYFEASDGVRLHGWFIPGRTDTVMLWLHGNAGNISHRASNILMLHRLLGIGVFIFDYRGYGRSGGTPSEAGLYRDADAAVAYLKVRSGFDPKEQLVLFGRSLGCAVAVEMSTRHDSRALVLEAPFTSVRAMSKRSNPLLTALLPVGVVIKSRFDSLSKIDRVKAPLMVIHGDRDDVIPIDVGRELWEAAREPKRFLTVPGAGHGDTYLVGTDSYFNALSDFIADPDVAGVRGGSDSRRP